MYKEWTFLKFVRYVYKGGRDISEIYIVYVKGGYICEIPIVCVKGNRGYFEKNNCMCKG